MSTEVTTRTTAGACYAPGRGMEGIRCSIVCAGLLAGCQGAPGPAPAPASSASAAASGPAASASASSSAAPIDESVAKPLSPRGAHALGLDIYDRQTQATTLARKYNPDPRVVVVENTFVVVAGDPSAPLDQAVAQVQQTTEALWHGPFFHRPEEGVTVWVFGNRATYERFRQEWALYDSSPRDLSFFRPRDRWIFFCPQGSSMLTLNHEVAHPLSLADAPHAAYWALEGLPAVLEMAQFDPDGGALVNAGAHFRLQTLRDALDSKTRAPLVRLDRLFPMTTREQFDDANYDLHFAMAREALRWLLRRGLLWDWWHRLRNDILDDPTGQKSFEAVVGPLDKAQDEWVAWIQSPESE
jgi:hypothetical protein